MLEVLPFHSSFLGFQKTGPMSFLRAVQDEGGLKRCSSGTGNPDPSPSPARGGTGSSASASELVQPVSLPLRCCPPSLGWREPSLVAPGGLCTFLLTGLASCCCCMLNSVMNSCPYLAASVISALILYFRAKLMYSRCCFLPEPFYLIVTAGVRSETGQGV